MWGRSASELPMESSYARSLSLATMRVLILKPHELADPGLVGEALRAEGRRSPRARAGPCRCAATARRVRRGRRDGRPVVGRRGRGSRSGSGRCWSGSGKPSPATCRCWASVSARRRSPRPTAGGWPAPAIPRSGSTPSRATRRTSSRPARGSCGTATRSVRRRARPYSRPHPTALRRTRSGRTCSCSSTRRPPPTSSRAWVAYDDADFRAAGLDPVETVEALRADEGPARERARRLVAAFLEGV